ncbi:hypothetical protein Nepgr_027252 [Nepenthes gracilis]|uniref:Uncharacterized protein n=1 Tax=Nepenthes gracilis TaxID=150966 RepID=A0AAD3Y2X6_NEPGR|nr:hypothetical protein Nepgr_027252 [Nepenthes gracilis]
MWLPPTNGGLQNKHPRSCPTLQFKLQLKSTNFPHTKSAYENGNLPSKPNRQKSPRQSIHPAANQTGIHRKPDQARQTVTAVIKNGNIRTEVHVSQSESAKPPAFQYRKDATSALPLQEGKPGHISKSGKHNSRKLQPTSARPNRSHLHICKDQANANRPRSSNLNPRTENQQSEIN